MLHDPTHVFFKLPRPVDRPIESPGPLLPKLYAVLRLAFRNVTESCSMIDIDNQLDQAPILSSLTILEVRIPSFVPFHPLAHPAQKPT